MWPFLWRTWQWFLLELGLQIIRCKNYFALRSCLGMCEWKDALALKYIYIYIYH